MHDPLAGESGSGRASLGLKTRALWIDCATAIAVLKATDGLPEMPSWLTDVVSRAYVRNDRKPVSPAAFVIQGMVQNA